MNEVKLMLIEIVGDELRIDISLTTLLILIVTIILITILLKKQKIKELYLKKLFL